MKYVKIVLFLLLSFISKAHCIAQTTFLSSDMQCHELRIANVIFDSISGDVYRVPLRKFGLRKFNYAVVIKASMEGDPTNYHHIPGALPTGDSFSFKLKAGTRKHGDTLMIIRRSGRERIQFAKISILAFREINVGPLRTNDKAFRKFFLKTYVRSYHSRFSY